jgi:hypothetical protein
VFVLAKYFQPSPGHGTTLHFLRNLPIGPISWSVILHLAGKACYRQTNQLTSPICNLLTKLSFVNTAPGTICTTLHFLRNLPIGPISWSVILHLAGKACYRQTNQLTSPICNLLRKLSFVNTAWHHIHNTIFSSQLTNRPNKLECYLTLGWKGLLSTNKPDYFANM